MLKGVLQSHMDSGQFSRLLQLLLLLLLLLLWELPLLLLLLLQLPLLLLLPPPAPPLIKPWIRIVGSCHDRRNSSLQVPSRRCFFRILPLRIPLRGTVAQRKSSAGQRSVRRDLDHTRRDEIGKPDGP